MHSEYREVFERFRDLVTSQCDEAMQSLDVDWHPNWRDHYHKDDLDKVLDILEFRDRKQSNKFPVNQWTNTGGLARARRDHPILDKPLPPLPSTSDGTNSLEPSPNSSISWTHTDSSHTAGASSHTTSPTNTSQVSASPTSPYPKTPTTSGIACLACSLTFSGTPQDAMSNLQRHLNETLRHNKNAGLKCPMPGCEKKNRQRSDNLGPHLQNFHGIISKSERQNIIKATKRSEGRLDCNGKSRRRSRRQSTSDSGTLVDESMMDLS